MNWRTVYDVAQVNPFDGWIVPLLIPCFFALVIFFLVKAPFLGRVSIFDDRNPPYATENQDSNRGLMAVVGGMVVAIVVCIIGFCFHHHLVALEYLQKGPHEKVEGVVSDFDPMPSEGHKNESFTVKGVRFEYSDYDATNPGFRRTTSHGGPIREGLPVRIWYKPAQPGHHERVNWISRLDTAAEGNQAF